MRFRGPAQVVYEGETIAGDENDEEEEEDFEEDMPAMGRLNVGG